MSDTSSIPQTEENHSSNAGTDEEHTASDDQTSHGTQEQSEEDGNSLSISVLAEALWNPSPDLDIVAVHGICGDNQRTWTTEEGDGSLEQNWFTEIVAKDQKCRVLGFSHELHEARESLSMAENIRQAARRLLSDLIRLRQPSDSDVPPWIVFVAHDIGGIIVKEVCKQQPACEEKDTGLKDIQALHIACLEVEQYGTIRSSTRLVIFFGCPHRCNEIEDIEDQMIGLLGRTSHQPFFGATSIIKQLAREIMEINGSFANSKMLLLLHIVSVYSDHPTGQIFDKYTATLDVPFEERIACPRAHEDICKIATEDSVLQRIQGALSDQLSFAARASEEEDTERVQLLSFLAAPVYPLQSPYAVGEKFHWIHEHETYTQWLESPGPSILHVYGNTGSYEAAEYIFRSLEEHRASNPGRETVLYFRFDKYDDRYNSIHAMLTNFLAQLLHKPDFYFNIMGQQYDQMSFHRSWSSSELWIPWRNALEDIFVEQDRVLCVINGLDECDCLSSRSAFLKQICHLTTAIESRVKIVITSNNDLVLQRDLAVCHSINLNDHWNTADPVCRNFASDVHLESVRLTAQNPVFWRFETVIAEMLSNNSHDPYWRRLALIQLMRSKVTRSKSAIQRELDLLPKTLEDMLRNIMLSVPHEKKTWARKVLCMVTHAFRPLTVWELGVACALEVDSMSNKPETLAEVSYHQVVAQLDDVFYGILVVKHNQVHFTNSTVRDFLLAAGRQGNIWYGVTEIAHQEIAQICQSYLSLPWLQEFIATRFHDYRDNSTGPPLPATQYSFSTYAIKYLPKHYGLIPQAHRSPRLLHEFFRDIKTVRCWAEAYWCLSNPVTRTDRAFVSSMPVLAGLGLLDLVIEHPDLYAKTPEASRDRALALTEAARNGHLETLRLLLTRDHYGRKSIEDALIAGASCGDGAVLEDLIKYASEQVNNFEWHPLLLTRAALFGLQNVVKMLLEAGAPIDGTFDMTPNLKSMTPLIFAIRHGHTELVEILIENKPDLTICVDLGRLPLHIASMYGFASATKLLLDAGAQIDAVDDDGRTALYFACLAGHYQGVQMLADAGSDLGCDTHGDWSPLTMVIDDGFIKCAQILLEHEANTEVEGPDNWTPLRFAISKGREDLCRLLLDNGANANTRSGGDPLLAMAAARGNLEIVKLLVESGAQVNTVDSTGRTALVRAADEGHVAVIAYLLDHGADIDHSDQYGQTAAILAAGSGRHETLRLLCNRGADIHKATHSGWTALDLSRTDVEITRTLVEHGADVNRLAFGETPCMRAAWNQWIGPLKVILSAKPDLEIQDDGGHTALTMAVRDGSEEVVRLLLEAGANVNHQTNYKGSPLRYAVFSNAVETVRTILGYRPDLSLRDKDGDTALHCIQHSTPVEIPRLLCNAGSDLESLNKDGYTPLSVAVECGNVHVVKYFISKKARLNITGGKLGGPLHIACQYSNHELVRILVSEGADFNLVDPNMGTPLQSSCLPEMNGAELQEKTISYLIHEAKADVTISGGDQGCALNAACAWTSPKVVRWILDEGATVDLEDGMGRRAIHFAAIGNMEHLQLILDAGGDVDICDKVGRSTLHWAVIGGHVDVVKRVLSLTGRRLVNQADRDGWTPLLWAARWAGTRNNDDVDSGIQKRMIQVLLDRGANPCVRVTDVERKWSAAKLARYHGQDRDVVQLLMEAEKKFADNGTDSGWDEQFHASRKARSYAAFCDGCFNNIYGIRYHCQVCRNFELCFKCYLSRGVTHPGHGFDENGPEYEEVEDPADDETSDNRTETEDSDYESEGGTEEDDDVTASSENTQKLRVKVIDDDDDRKQW